MERKIHTDIVGSSYGAVAEFHFMVARSGAPIACQSGGL